ncbi:MAG: hypothetical protein IKE20_02325 [Eggerthellaceae bacterium]|nr:hypothetical protein [Eggerthellaceae bacterium]
MSSETSILEEIADTFGLAGKEPSAGLVDLIAQESGKSSEYVKAVFKT